MKVEWMNIWDLAIGETGISEDGKRYKLTGIRERRLPSVGRTPVLYTLDEDGKLACFIRGISVRRSAAAGIPVIREGE